MKLRYLYSLAALSLLTAACSSDENTQDLSGVNGQKIPFTATISVGDATTRSLTEATDGSAITTSWVKDEQVVLIHNGVVDVMTVTAVDDQTKAATITGEISGNPVNGDDVTVVYPASAVDQETNTVKADLLKAQDGTLATISEKLDYRTAETTLAVSEGGSTFGSSVTLALQYAIWKLSLTDGSNAISASKLVVKDGSDNVLTTVTLAPAASSLFVAMTPANSADMKFEATVGEDVYTYSKTGITLKAGKYNQSTMAMNAPEPGKMTVSATGYKGTYDSQAHGITVSVTEPATGATIKYGVKEGEYNLDASPTYTDAGKYTVYYQVTMDKYETVTGNADVEITQAAATISFTDATITKTIGDAAFTNTLTNTGDGAVKYSTTATNVTVDATTGEVTIVGAGEATITATVADGTNYAYATKTITYKVTVSKKAGSISYATQTVEKTTSDAAFTNTLTKVGDGAVTYSSDKESVATVNSTTGEVTIKGAGEATITATVADSDTYTYATKTATYTLTVLSPPSISKPDDYTSDDNPF